MSLNTIIPHCIDAGSNAAKSNVVVCLVVFFLLRLKRCLFRDQHDFAQITICITTCWNVKILKQFPICRFFFQIDKNPKGLKSTDISTRVSIVKVKRLLLLYCEHRLKQRNIVRIHISSIKVRDSSRCLLCLIEKLFGTLCNRSSFSV